MSKKNPLQNAFIILAIAIALGALSYFVVKPRQEAKDKSKDAALLLYAGAEKTQIEEFRFTNANGSFDVKRKADNHENWFLKFNDKVFDADKSSTDALLSTLLAAKKESKIDGTPELKALGLEPPKYRLSMASGQNPIQRELWVGEDTPVDYLVYAKWSDNPEVFLTTRSLRFSLDKKVDELRNKKVLAADLSTLAKIEIKTGGIDKIPAQHLLFEKGENGEWRHSKVPLVKVESAELDKFLKNLSGLNVVAFPSEDPSERKSKYGFWKNTASLTLTPSDPKKSPETWALAAAYDRSIKKDKLYWARLDQPSTYEVSDTFKDNFKVDLFHFRTKKLPLVKREEIKFFSVQDGLQNLEFTKNGSEWTVKAQVLKGALEGKAKKEYVEEALAQLAELKPTEYLDGRSPYVLGLQKPSRVVELRADKEKTLGTYFFGKKLGEDKVVFRTEGMDAAAAVVFKMDDVLSFAPEQFLEAPVVPENTGAKGLGKESQTPPLQKGVKMQLDATVKTPKEIQKLPASIVKPGHRYTAEMTLNTGAKLVITFTPDKAPYTVSNFIHLARNRFYDGVKFHRVIRDFVVQGGDPTGTGTGGPGYKFDNEDNDLKHKTGAISMAHAGRNTNGSQFFLVLKPQAHLDGVHTVFGEITEGLDKLESIKQGDSMSTVKVFEEAL